MLRYVRKFSRSTLAKAVAGPAPAASQTLRPAAGSLPRRPGPGASYWSAVEARLLIDWERNHRPVLVQMNDSKPRQSLILGVDLVKNQLLLDSLMPAPAVSHLSDNQPFWLSLPMPTVTYRVCVLARAPEPGQRRGTILADIIATRQVSQPTEPAAVTFTTELGRAHVAPKVEFQLDSGKRVQARLRRLSGRGLLLASDRLAVRDLRQTKGDLDCIIHFNSNFHIQCRVRVDSRSRPAEHTLAALTFTQLSPQDRLSLHQFLDSCARVSPHTVVAA